MPSKTAPNSWLVTRAQEALRRGFTHAYETVRVDPAKYLVQLQIAHRLPISTYHGVRTLDVAVLDNLAEETIHASIKIAAVEGAGLGLGGIFTVLPDLSILAAITLRTVQKLSLIYGFEYNTDAEVADLWVAMASAAGVDIGREVVEKELVNRFIPRVIRSISVKAGGEVVEKWSARLVPVVSSFLGAGLNYYFVRAWGRRARQHFRERHLEMRRQLALTSASAAP
jgi:hypothetical protein